MLHSGTAQKVAKFAPMVMSLLAVALVIEGAIEFGSRPPADEGWQAHLFQLLMVLEAPLIAAFAVSRWRSLRANLPVLGAQVGLWVLALGVLRISGL